MYALDLIPRQSALNVADANLTSHSYGFAGFPVRTRGFAAGLCLPFSNFRFGTQKTGPTMGGDRSLSTLAPRWSHVLHHMRRLNGVHQLLVPKTSSFVMAPPYIPHMAL